MSDILSQSEIDSLLDSLSSGAQTEADFKKVPKGEKIQLYDFKYPSKFNKEQLRTLEIIFENYSRMVSSFFSAYLRTSVKFDVVAAEQLTYGEFNNSLINPIVLSIVDAKPFKGPMIVDMSADLGFAIIDRILGGPGLGISISRDFSDIERILLERIMTQMLSFLPEPWENVCELVPKLEKIETNSQFVQIISLNEIVALITLNAKIGSVDGFLSFCIPDIAIEPFKEKLNTKYWFSKKSESEENKLSYKEQLSHKIETTKIPVIGVIGSTNITIEDFLQLQVGDIIPLDSFINSDLNIMVGDLLKFKGKPGINRGKNAIQITKYIGKED